MRHMSSGQTWILPRLLIASFALALLLTAGANAVSKESPKDAPDPPRAYSHQEYGPYKSWPIRGSDAAQTTEPEPTRTEQDVSQQSKYERRILLFTAILTIATVLYMVFAGLQWLTMRRHADLMAQTADAATRSADAARRNTETLVGLEAPNFFIYAVELRRGGNNHADLLAGAQARFTFCNYGRTPAIVISYCLDHFVGDSLPSEPDYKNVVHEPYEVAVGIDQPTAQWYPVVTPLSSLSSDDDVRAVTSGVRSLWIYGYIVFGGILRETWKRGFCYRWTERDPQGAKGFRPVDQPGYSYYTKE